MRWVQLGVLVMHQRPDRQDPTLEAPLATICPEQRLLLSFIEHSRPCWSPSEAQLSVATLSVRSCVSANVPRFPKSHLTPYLSAEAGGRADSTTVCTTSVSLLYHCVTSYLKSKAKQNKTKQNILRKGLFGLSVFGATPSWRGWHRDRNVRQLAKLCPHEADR